jgi:hypothetical protein
VNRRRASEEETTPPDRRAGSAWWLISRYGGLTDVLSVDSGGEEALAVFSFDEEAELFLQLGALGDGWRIESVATDELFSQLLDSRAPFRRVALDPFPEVAGRRMVDLVCVSRERFVQTYGSGYPQSNGTRLRALP